MQELTVTINTQPRTIPAMTVAELVDHEAGGPEGVAVAIGGEVVPRSQWGDAIEDGAVIDILSAVQGG